MSVSTPARRWAHHVQRSVGWACKRGSVPDATVPYSARRASPHRLPVNTQGWLRLRGVTRNNLDRLDADIPLGVFTSVTGISGSGKSSLISQFLVDAVGDELGHRKDLR